MESRTLDLRQFAQDKQSQNQPSSRPSTTFNSIGRQKQAHWSNRFRKDFNDLAYDVKYSLIKGKDDIKFKPKYQNKLRDSRKSRSNRSSDGGSNMDKNKTRIEMIKMNGVKNSERFHISEKKLYSTLDTQGLCKFQFEKTIGGKLIHKSNHHLGFQHQTHRSVNLNSVWYNPENQVSAAKVFEASKLKNSSHQFASYTARKVFQPREELDKFYDTERSLRLASARTIKQPCKIKDLVGRKPLIPPRSASLSYNEYESRKKIMNKICSYPINRISRELKFTRQVISPERGCYR